MHKRIRINWHILTLLAVLVTGSVSAGTEGGKSLSISHQDYSFAYWLNGWRKVPDDSSADLLCIESGRYGLVLDLSDLQSIRFGLLHDNLDYTAALRADSAQRIAALNPAQLLIDVEVNGEVYRATTCRAALGSDVKRLKDVRMWESGKLVQHFDLLGLVFKNDEGRKLACDGTLDIVAWPDAITLNLDLTPVKDSQWSSVKTTLRLKGNNHEWHVEKTHIGDWAPEARKRTTLTCSLQTNDSTPNKVTFRLTAPQDQTFPVSFDESYSCHAARVKGLKRPWKTGYTDIRNYDEFDLVIENPGNPTYIPFLLELANPANITGLCPMLCDENGIPTGIPVQLSKNWHEKIIGAYLRAYALIPAQRGTTKYKMRIVYGFYGTLPSASHAQLSLVGYGGNGRWEQLAIGCWGETMCLDMDMSLVDVAITDARMLMTRNGPQGKKWAWTDGGWGGDWLNVKDDQKRKLCFVDLKTAYLAHGPCLTEIQYNGSYGSERNVALEATVRTLRTDDYARTFHTLRYTFRKPVSAESAWLFKMGKTGGLATPEIAYGNALGLIGKHTVPNNLQVGDKFIGPLELSGEGPWWIAFPGAHHTNGKDWGTGSRALIIRSFQAYIDGKKISRPTIAFPVFQVGKNGVPNLDLLLTPPGGVGEFSQGDSVAFEVEWITLPRIAADYYGPNESFRKHLEKNPHSWKSVYREAKGNDLTVQVVGGTVKHTYPVIIQAADSEVQVDIQGGVGMVPIRFDGLNSANNHVLYKVAGKEWIKLDQSVHGNDFWQTDYSPQTDTFSVSFNIPLDGEDKSRWILKKD